MNKTLKTIFMVVGIASALAGIALWFAGEGESVGSYVLQTLCVLSVLGAACTVETDSADDNGIDDDDVFL